MSEQITYKDFLISYHANYLEADLGLWMEDYQNDSDSNFDSKSSRCSVEDNIGFFCFLRFY